MDQRSDLERGAGPDPFLSADPYAADQLGRVSSYDNDNSQQPDDQDSDIAEQRANIEDTRAELSGTIDAIQQKLSPGNIVQGAKDSVKEATVGRVEDVLNSAGDTVQQAASAAEDTVTRTGGSIIQAIKQNPVPAALAGIGLGWLFMEARKQGAQSSDQGTYRSYGSPYLPSDYRGAPHTAYGGTSSRPDAGQQWDNGDQSQQGSTVGQAVNQAQDTVGQVANQAQQTAGQMANQVQQQAQQVAGGFEQMTQDRPLAIAAGALALGIAVGLAIPETQKEDQLMGQARETVVQKVEQVAQNTVQKAENVAQQALGSTGQATDKQSK